jgi:hypothetical protein
MLKSEADVSGDRQRGGRGRAGHVAAWESDVEEVQAILVEGYGVGDKDEAEE